MLRCKICQQLAEREDTPKTSLVFKVFDMFY